MRPVTIHGFKCLKKDEKALIQRVNEYLAGLLRTTSKSKNSDMLRAYSPLSIKHFYWNLNKDTGTYLDIYPNEDIEGKWFFGNHRDCAWLMHVRIDVATYPAATQAKAETFIQSLIDATNFESFVIRESDHLLEGLPRGEFA